MTLGCREVDVQSEGELSVFEVDDDLGYLAPRASGEVTLWSSPGQPCECVSVLSSLSAQSVLRDLLGHFRQEAPVLGGGAVSDVGDTSAPRAAYSVSAAMGSDAGQWDLLAGFWKLVNPFEPGGGTRATVLLFLNIAQKVKTAQVINYH